MKSFTHKTILPPTLVHKHRTDLMVCEGDEHSFVTKGEKEHEGHVEASEVWGQQRIQESSRGHALGLCGVGKSNLRVAKD